MPSPDRVFLRYALLQELRAEWCRPDANHPGRGAISLPRILVPTLVAVAGYAIAIGVGAALSNRVRTDGLWIHGLAPSQVDSSLAFVLGLLTILYGFLVGLTTGLYVSRADESSRSAARSEWPVPARSLHLPPLVSGIGGGLIYHAILGLPWVIGASLAIGSNGAQAFAAGLAVLGLSALCAAFGALVGALGARISSVMRDRGLAAVALVGFLFSLGATVTAVREVQLHGVESVLSSERRIEAIAGPSLLAAAILHPPWRFVAPFLVLVLPVAALLLSAASAVIGRQPLGDVRRFESRPRRASSLAALEGGTFPHWLQAGELTPFLRKDLLAFRREPGQVIRRVAILIFMGVLLARVFPGHARSVALLIVFYLPTSLGGSLLLHAIGREGSMMETIRQIAGTDRFLRAKVLLSGLTIGLATLAAITVCLGFIAPLEGWIARILVATLAVLSSWFVVLLTCGMAALFADFGTKRLRPDHGVRLEGELLYWPLSGFAAYSFYFLSDSVVRYGGSWRVVIGFALVCMACLLALGLYMKGEDVLREGAGSG